MEHIKNGWKLAKDHPKISIAIVVGIVAIYYLVN